ncbi:MAG TPA: ABC transporter permease [Sphaerochaeta sp.]|nr:ABC transporter permease [Sphaerochaeta sp.]
MKREFVIFLIKKLAKVLFTVWVVTTLIFFLIRLMPSNPIQQYVQNLVVQYGMTYEEASARASSLFSIDLDANVFSQYIRYLQQAARLDFGTSFLSPGVQVSEIIAARLPWTLFTVGSGLLLSFIVGTVLGAIAAYRRESWYEPIISGVSSFLSAIPDFLIAIFLILFFGVFTWGGRGSIIPIFQLRGNFSPGATIGWNWEFIGSVLDHAMVPILTYFFSQIGIWVLLMKGSTAGCLNADYATIARARGLRPGKILGSYIGRNAMLPIVTEFAMRLGFIIGGSLIIEQLFVYQGIGLELLKATSNRDYPLMQGIFLIMTVAIVLSNLLAEILYGVLDPRIRAKGGSRHA